MTVEGSEGSRTTENEQESGTSVATSAAKTIVFEASKRRLVETRYVDMVNVASECAGDQISVVAQEKSRDSGWNRCACLH